MFGRLGGHVCDPMADRLLENPTPSQFPIRDLAWHREGLSIAQDVAAGDRKALRVLTNWHGTAIAYLQCGHANGLDGPAAEYRHNRRVDTVEIEPELWLVADVASGKRRGAMFGYKIKGA